MVVRSVPSSGAFVTGWSPKVSGDVASQPADLATPTVQPQRLLRHDRGEHLPGDLLGGKYTVRDVLGRGSTGITYKVRRTLETLETYGTAFLQQCPASGWRCRQSLLNACSGGSTVWSLIIHREQCSAWEVGNDMCRASASTQSRPRF